MTLRIALAQVNPKVGDLTGNAALIRRVRDSAAERPADLVVFPELSITGYPPEDLVLRPAFVAAAADTLQQLAREQRAGSPAIIVGLPWIVDGRLHNAVALLDNGRIEIRLKHELPNYGVFDEKRVFTPGPLPEPVEFRGVKLGVPVCEDVWFPEVTRHLASRGADMLLVPNGSPFEVDKLGERLALLRRRTAEARRPIVYVNQVGGQDELVFDGGSFVLNSDGQVALVLPSWVESVAVTEWQRDGDRYRCAGKHG